MLINLFSSRGWESWGLEHRPLIPERMPVLIDDDLRFEDGPGAPRPTLAVNRWLQELPVSGAPAVSTWHTYGRIVKDWMEFLEVRGVSVFAGREALRWALAEGHAQAEPFSYRVARGMFAGRGGEVWVNRSARRRPKPHVTIKYLEPDFTAMFLNALAGLCPDGSADRLFRGRELARNHAIGQLAVATGLRLQEFTYLLSYEIPPLPRTRTDAPIAFGVPSGVTKGRKFRTTWISYDALAGVDQYLQLDREAATAGSAWTPPAAWGEPLRVSEPDERGGRINGIRRRWEVLTPAERRRLVAPGGRSCLVAVQADGGPFTAWGSVFERTSDRIRDRFEPRFPHVTPHRARHT